MLDLQRIPMSRVRRGYELTPHQANDLIQALCPHAVFPLGLWQRTYEHFWKDYARSASMRYKMECPLLPEVMLEPGKYFYADLCAQNVMTFFSKISLHIYPKILKKGLEYILAETFDTFDTVYPEDRVFLFSTLEKMEQRGSDYDIYDVENSNDEVLCLPASSYHFILHIFFDTMLVDRVAAVLHLRDFPLLHEQKGLTHAFVKYVLNPVLQEIPIKSEEVAKPVEQIAEIQPQKPQEQASAPCSTGSKKDSERIKATQRACEEIADELHNEKQLFEDNKGNWKQLLIFDNGKTNWKTFLRTVETRLGFKPHHDAAREVWKKVPENLKHNGRMREQ